MDGNDAADRKCRAGKISRNRGVEFTGEGKINVTLMAKKQDTEKITPFNPLDKKHLGESVAEALLEQPSHPLPPQKSFEGAGIYAIYYGGDFPLYESIVRLNNVLPTGCPIYVGKAIPPGARKGGLGLDVKPGQALYKRLSQHARNISGAVNLNITHFTCKFLVVDDIWIPLAESLLIRSLSPIWNQVINGFGNNDPGRGRHGQRKSDWDIIHPGRTWAGKLAGSDIDIDHISKSKQEKINAIADKLRQKHNIR